MSHKENGMAALHGKGITCKLSFVTKERVKAATNIAGTALLYSSYLSMSFPYLLLHKKASTVKGPLL